MKKIYLYKNIKTLRKRKNMTQEFFSEEIRVSKSCISSWEENRSYPKLEKIIKIAEYFNVTLDELITTDIQSATKNSIKTDQINSEIVHPQWLNRHFQPLPKKKAIIKIFRKEVGNSHYSEYTCEWIPIQESKSKHSEGYLGCARVLEGTHPGIGFNAWKQNDSEFFLYKIVE